MTKKDVIYIDVEDDITTIIDKITGATEPLAAMVLPKRTQVLQSIVNMRLLKRTADSAGKKLVLVTNEKALLPLAGTVGLHVADSLQSVPAIPAVPETPGEEDLTVVEEESADEAVIDEPAAKADSSQKEKPAKDGKKKDKKGDKDDKKKTVPNFSKFRLKIIIAVAAFIVLAVIWFVAFYLLPTAKITIFADATPVNATLKYTVNTKADKDDIKKKVLSGDEQTITKSISQDFTATGKQNIGKKASGTMTVENCDSSDDITVPAGTVFIDPASGNQFTSNSAVNVPGGSFGGGGCKNAGEADVSVTATASGDDKNLGPRSYTSNVSSLVTGSGGQMTGGTTETVTVVTADDVEAATKKISDRNQDDVKGELAKKFADSQFMIEETFTANAGSPSVTPAVGQRANSGQVTISYTFKAVAVNEASLKKLLEEAVAGDSDSSQAILETGFAAARVEVGDFEGSTFDVSMDTQAQLGPDINRAALADEISGKRFGEVDKIISAREGVRDVDIKFRPFWVFSAPRASRITIEVKVSDQ